MSRMNVNSKEMDLMYPASPTIRRVRIFDTTLRDGEQAPGATLYPEEKIRLAQRLARLGVDVIEPGFPVSSPGEFAAVQQISRMLNGVEIAGFARAIRGDIDSAAEATQDAQQRRLHLFISSSQIHLDFQLRKSREEVIRIAREMVAYAKSKVDRIEFSPMDASRAGVEFLMEMVEAVIEEGATIINIPDTVGYALPSEFGALFGRLRREVRGAGQVEFSAHCHNDLGLAVANSLAAIQAGASQVEVTVNGVGERAGNCSLEELVMAIETRKDSLGVMTGIHTEEIYETSRLVSRMMHFPIAYNKPIVGRNAFQHESGIHQDGLLKNRQTYEIMDPDRMGIPRSMLILGKHSGRHALKHRIGQYGVKLDEQQLDDVYRRFKETADELKRVSDQHLIDLVGDSADRVMERFSMVQAQIMSSSGQSRVAAVTVRDNEKGKEQTYSGVGDGPVEAIVRSLEQAFPLMLEFVDLELYSISEGEQAEGEAVVTLAVAEGKGSTVAGDADVCGEGSGEASVQAAAGSRDTYRGTGIDRDILLAVARAYVSAANQACQAQEGGKSLEEAV
jgi:2-isopropylmalate synthase